MKYSPVPLDGLTASQRAELERLTTVPKVNWQDVAIYVVMVSAFLVSTVAAVMGAIPLWVGTIVNSIAGYWVFTLGHDGVHRSIASNAKLNDFLGQTALMLGGPYISLKIFRWCHIRHHRFANGKLDPDTFFDGAWWTLPFRWASVDFYYLYYIIRHGDKVVKGFLKESIVPIVLSVVGAVWAVYAGYGMELLMLWFVPSRVLFGLVGFAFFWLPHTPHGVKQEDNYTKATSVRLGYEPLMAFLLQFQHMHLIHHLFPMTPSGNNEKVWNVIKSELMKQDLAIQHNFDIHPTYHHGAAGQAVTKTV